MEENNKNKLDNTTEGNVRITHQLPITITYFM